jgi:hypothetical protein
MNMQCNKIRTAWMSFKLPYITAGFMLFLLLTLDLLLTLCFGTLPEPNPTYLVPTLLRYILTYSLTYLSDATFDSLLFWTLYLSLILASFFFQLSKSPLTLDINLSITDFTALFVLLPMCWYQVKADALRIQPEYFFDYVTILLITVIFV